MGYSYYQKYAFAVACGAVLLLFVMFMLFTGESTYDAAQHQTVMHAKDLLNSGDSDRALAVLEDLVIRAENPDALKLLAIEYSREEADYYNMNKAILYAETLRENHPSEEAFYQSMKMKALNNF
jgi:hypothetical protein